LLGDLVIDDKSHPDAHEMTLFVIGFPQPGNPAPLRRSNKVRKSRGLLHCFSLAGTLPQVLCKREIYCSGDTAVVQVAIVAELKRTTASANEQK
jgi:hypothetical protein